MSKDINKRLAELEAKSLPSTARADAEAEHLFMLLPPDVQAYNMRVYADVLRRLPADEASAAWLAAYQGEI